MKLTGSTIYIDNLHLHAFHGVMEQERRIGADFLVSIRAACDVSRAMESDQVEDTLSYADLLEVVKHEMAQPSQLLEHVAGRIAKTVFRCFPQVTSLDLRLTKQNPPMGADCDGAGVELHLINDKTCG